jgi:hypothetical protein
MKCPGQDTQYWKPGAIFEAACPRCGATVEFFKDDTSRKCRGCGQRFVNPQMDFGCAAYCPYAEQCLGDLPPELVAQKEDLLKDRVAAAVKRQLKADFRRIGHAARRARHAEEIGKRSSASLPLVLMAAYLWDLDEGRSNGDLPEARAILDQLKAPPPLVEHVCALIAGRGVLAGDRPPEYEMVADAEAIAALEEAHKTQPMLPAVLEQRIDSACHTTAGRERARKVLKIEVTA